MKGFRGSSLTLCFLLFLRGIVSAAELSPTYTESVQIAQDHAISPTGWTAPSLFTIPDPAGTEGLTYSGGMLIVRTATKSRNFKTNYVGQAGYKIYGPATTEASWVTTGNDATNFLRAHGATGANVTTLLERGLGMDATGTHDAIVEFAVDTQYLLRPTRNPDITQYLPSAYGDSAPFVKPAGMSDTAFENFKAYYENWKKSAYGSYPFPWTQLGYTFFWGNGHALSDITGMSEFILLGQTPVAIYGIYATQSYLYTLNKNGAFSSDSDAQYGNGFASFKIDGSCDTVWAGHRFQSRVSSNTADGSRNEIRIEDGGSVSGGQGILIWSLNYDLTNRGVISGATSDKFGIAGTANVAVLFKGDTGTGYGTPVTTGANRVVNSGTISSPGTAIKAEAGDTLITNQPGGIISGGNYAVQTGSGNDTVTVQGGRIAGDIDLGAGTDSLTVTGADDARLTFTLNRDTAASARIANVETVSMADRTTLAVQVAGDKPIRNNESFLIVDAAALTVDAEKLTIQNDSAVPMVTFAAQQVGNSLSLVAARDATFYARNGGNTSLGTVLDGLVDTATGDMASVLAALDRSGDADNARRLEPTVDGGAIQAGYETDDQFTRAIVGRIDQALTGRPSGPGTGDASAGGGAEGNGVWAQASGAYLHQGARGASGGTVTDLKGGTFGYDRPLGGYGMMGFGGMVARSRVRGLDSGAKTDADHYEGGLYCSLFRGAYHLGAILSYAHHRYDASRAIGFGTISRTAMGDYAGRHYSGYMEGGYTLRHDGYLLQPILSLHYLRMHLNGYTERGADALNLTVEDQTYNRFQTGLGVRISRPIRAGNVRIIPEIHAKWLYDFIGDRQEAVAQMAGGGASFTTRGFDPPQSGYSVGAKIAWMTTDRMAMILNYDFGMKEDFYSHGASLQLRYLF